MTAEEEVAHALETEVELLPWIDELLADIPALGSDPEDIVELLAQLPLAPGRETRVLDLGCGKGAVAVAIARSLGHRVTGVDLFAPFIEASRRLAAESGVDNLCEFRQADLRTFLDAKRPFDAAVFAAVGDVLGTPDETVGQLRRGVKAGGYLLISDGFLADTGVSESGGSSYFGHGETLRRLTAHGDGILREVVDTPEEVAAENRRNNERIQARAERLVAREPGLASLVEAFVERQKEECRTLETEMTCATWVLRRT